MKPHNYSNFTINRVESFSDGVFAIVVTLLVFDIKFAHIAHPTNANVWAAIVSVFPKMVAWINSFLVVCVIWVNHHRVIGALKRIDAGVFWLNNLLLMFTSLMPFPTGLLGEYPGNNAATFFYGLCLSLPAIFFSAMAMYITKNVHLLKVDLDVSVLKKSVKLHSIYGPVAYLLGAALSWASVWAAIAVYSLISVYFIAPRIKLNE